MANAVPDQSKWYIPAASLFLYLAACTLPCLEFRNGTIEVYYGYSILLQGWMAVLVGQVAWLANPAWLASMGFFIFRRWTLSLAFAALSLIFAAGSFLINRKSIVVLPDTPGRNLELSSLRIGFYVWLTSLVIIGAGAFYEKMIGNRSR